MKNFTLHPKLAQDCVVLGQLDLCHVLLMNNALFPWFILVPEVEEEQLHKLSSSHRETLYAEAQRVSQRVEELYSPTRLNCGAIGNVVPQLHYHIVARKVSDPAWPNVVWGCGLSTSYSSDEIEAVQAQFSCLF